MKIVDQYLEFYYNYLGLQNDDCRGCEVKCNFKNTIHFDDIKVLQGNPSGAFDIVKPE